MGSNGRILVVDDQAGVRRSLAILLKKEGYPVQDVENGKRAAERLEEEQFDVVITDLKMSPGTGLDVLYYVKEKKLLTAVIIMTGFGTIDSAVLAMKMGAFDYLAKPFKNEEILHRVRKALDQINTRKEFDSIGGGSKEKRGPVFVLGKSRAMQEITSLAEKIAKVDLPVLITGKTGTGKNLVAAVIHHNSMRAEKPFISINCAGIPEYLIESELFGHAKGAFTGAFIARKGLFEEANGGTLLLDEIGSIPVTMQAKLLDVLQSRVIRQVGSNRSREVDVRTMTTTNTDLEQAVRNRQFREDLYYRIKVTHIHIPPLRERLEDIPLLAEHFLDLCRKEFKKPDLHFSQEVVNFLCEYDYSGNVRELHNMISNAAAVSAGPVITMQDLSLSLTNKLFEVSPGGSKDSRLGTKDEWEKDLIMKSIREHSHNLARVCEGLGIGRTTLWRKMKKYNIE